MEKRLGRVHTWQRQRRRKKEGYIPSEHLRRLIQTFLTQTLGKTAPDESENDDADASDMDPDIKPLELTFDQAKKILRSSVRDEFNNIEDKNKRKVHEERRRKAMKTLARQNVEVQSSGRDKV